MRIAILSPFSPYRGGIAQFSGMLYQSLLAEGEEVRAFNFTRLYPDILFPGKTQYAADADNQLPVPSTRCLDSINPLSYFKTVEEIAAFAPDVLIISYWISFFVPAYAHVANRLKRQCKVVVLIHNAVPHEPRIFDKPLAKLLFNQSDGFVVLSENVARDLLSIRPKSQYLLTPHPLYTHFGDKQPRAESCAALGLDPQKKTLLFFGLIRSYKGLDLLIDAFSKLDSSYQLLIAGECYGSFDRYQAQLDATEAKERIYVFNQYIKDQELALFFSSADALVLPYRSATQSGVLALAYHFELPVLSTPVGDFHNSISASQIGVVADDVSAEALAAGVDRLFCADRMQGYRAKIKEMKAALAWDVFARKVLDYVAAL